MTNNLGQISGPIQKKKKRKKIQNLEWSKYKMMLSCCYVPAKTMNETEIHCLCCAQMNLNGSFFVSKGQTEWHNLESRIALGIYYLMIILINFYGFHINVVLTLYVIFSNDCHMTILYVYLTTDSNVFSL